MDERQTICDYLGGLEMGRVKKYKNMAITPLVNKSMKSELEYKVLHEAIDDGSFVIKEAGSYGVVNGLTAYVDFEEPILVLKGEYVVGGKQNRMITVNGLIAKNEGKISIPVHCVQHGRWSYGGLEKDGVFKSQEIVSAALRGEVSKAFSDSSGQSATWNSVAQHLSKAGVSSGSQDFGKIYQDRDKEISDFVEAFDYVPGQVGFIAAVQDDQGNVSTYIDVFDQQKTLSKHGERLLRSYAVDAVAHDTSKINFSAEDAERFLELLKSSNMDVSESISLGKDVEISKNLGSGYRTMEHQPANRTIVDCFPHRQREDRITGSGLVHRDQVVYIGAQRRIRDRSPFEWGKFPPIYARPSVMPLNGYEEDNVRRRSEPDFGPNNGHKIIVEEKKKD